MDKTIDSFTRIKKKKEYRLDHLISNQTAQIIYE